MRGCLVAAGLALRPLDGSWPSHVEGFRIAAAAHFDKVIASRLPSITAPLLFRTGETSQWQPLLP